LGNKYSDHPGWENYANYCLSRDDYGNNESLKDPSFQEDWWDNTRRCWMAIVDSGSEHLIPDMGIDPELMEAINKELNKAIAEGQIDDSDPGFYDEGIRFEELLRERAGGRPT
jgi:hypothetical protein